MIGILGDLRYAVRTWLRTPGFTIVVILTLSLGIGANTTMFGIVNATLLQSLPFPGAERLVTVWKGRVDNPDSLQITSWPNYQDWKARSGAFAAIGLFDSAGRGYSLTGAADAEQVSGVRVTASFFDVLGVPPLLGRTFHEEEEMPGRDRVVVLSHGLWTRRFGADPGLVGRTIDLDGAAHTVIGVMPADFRFQFWSGTRELWVPAGWTAGDRDRDSNSFICIGRLRDGVSLDQARAEMDVIGRALAVEYPEANAGRTVRLVPLAEYGVGGVRPALLTLLGIVGFVLLIACVNVANLMLSRSTARVRELAIRRALGASSRRLVRQLLTENLGLALLGGAGGILLATWGTSLLLPILPGNLRFMPFRPLERIDLDPTVLAFTAIVSIASGVLFGLAPALVSLRPDLTGPLKESARGSTGAKGRLRHALVASEVALALMVLAGAGVMILSVARLLRVDPGLDPRNVLVMGISLPQENLYYGPPVKARFCEDFEQRAGGVPGVVSASAVAHLPLSGGGAGRGIAIEGRDDPGPDRQPGAGYSVACPGLLRTLGIPLVAGREFTHRDTLGAPGVVIVNRAMAERFWPGEDAVGKRLKIGRHDTDAPWLTVVGVHENVRHFGLDSEIGPSFLRPYTQSAWPFMSLVVKTAAAPASFVAPLKRALAEIEPDQPVSNVATMETVVGASVSSRRFPMLLLSGFGLLALALAGIGIAGVVSYSVGQRTQEIGLRIALGAQSRDILRLIVGHSLSWTLAGVAVGVAGAVAVLRLLAPLLYEVTPADPFVLGGVSAVLVVVAAGASYLPARRALGVDPATALRCE